MTLSIIIPIYNAEKYLVECLNSVKNQNYSDFECILIDDGSTDSSAKICEDFSSKDSRFKVFHIKNNGVSNARNIGIKNSAGKYITFIDSDDYINKETYSNLMSIIIKENIEICCFNFNRIDINNRVIKHNYKNNDLNKNFIKDPIYMNSVWNKIYKKELFLNNKIFFDTSITTSEDLLVTFKLFTLSKKNKFISEAYYNYRITPESITNSCITQKKVDDTFFVSQEILKFCTEKNIIKQYKEYISFLNLISNIPLITNKKLYNPNLYRLRTFTLNIWIYSFNIKYFLLSLTTILHMDIFTKLFIMLKTLKGKNK